MAQFLRRAVIVAAILFGLIAAILLLLNTTYVKGKIANYAESYLRDQYGIRAELGQLDYRLDPPLRITVNDLRIYGGPSNDELFAQANTALVEIPYSSFWGDVFRIRLLSLDTPKINPEKLPRMKEQPPSAPSEEGRQFAVDDINITGGGLTYQGIQVENVAVQATVRPDQAELKSLTARVKEIHLRLSGQVNDFSDPEYQIRYEANGQAKSISELFPQAPALQGKLQASGVATGDADTYKVEGKLQAQDVSVRGEPPLTAHASYIVDSSDTEAPYKMNLTWRSLPLSAARQFFPEAPPLASLSNGQASYKGGNNFWKGTGSFSARFLQGGQKGLQLLGNVEGNISNGAIHIQPSELRLEASRIAFSGTLRENSADLQLNASVPNPSSLAFLSPQLNNVPGSYSVDSEITGNYKNLQVVWDLQGSAPQMKLTTTGQYFTGTKQLNADFQGNAGGEFVNRFSPDLQASGQIAFQGKASGSVSNPVIDAKIQGENLSLKGTRVGDVQVTASSDGKILRANAQIPAYSVTADATYAFDSQQYKLQANIQSLEADQIREFLPAAAGDVDGAITGTLTASGNAANWRASDATLEIQQAEFQRGKLQVGLKEGSEISLRNNRLHVDLTTLMTEGQMHVQGTAPLSRTGQIDLQAKGETNLKLVSLFDPSIQATGPVQLDVSVRGTLSKPEYYGDFTIPQFEASLPERNLQITQGSTKVQLQGDKAQVDATLAVNGSPLQATGTVPLSPSGEMNVDVTGTLQLSLISQVTDQVEAEGTVQVDVHLAGSMTNPKYSGSIRSDQFQVAVPTQNILFSNARMHAQFDGSQVNLDTAGQLNGSPLTINGTVPLKQTPGNIQVTLTSFPVSSLAPERDLSGQLTVQLDAKGTGTNVTAWDGTLTITPENLSLAGRQLDFSQPLQVQLDTGQARLLPLQIEAGEYMDVSMQGHVNFRTGAIAGSVRAKTEMAMFTTLLTDAVASGILNANVDLGGTLNRPQLSGLVQINDGVFRKFQSPIMLERINLVAPISTDGITIQTLNARMGGGTITGGGKVALENWKPGEIEIWAKADNVGMHYPQDVRSQIDADIRFTSLEEDYLVSGSVVIVRSTYREDIDPRERLVNSLLSQRAALTAPPPVGGRIRLDLTVETGEDFQMKNNLGKIQAGADLQIAGFIDQPRVSGRLSVRERSEIYFERNTFEVQRGVIDFYGRRRITPVFDIELFTIARDTESRQEYEITIPLSGPLTDLDERDPTSYPALTPQQIYFLLLTGHADAQISRAGTIFFQQQLASYISGQVFSDLERQLAGALGLTRVEIQPEMISSETEPGAKVVLGKDFTSALSLYYSVSLTGEEATWIADYQAPKNLSLRFVTQEEGSYTANVRHLVRFGSGVSTGALRREGRVRNRYINAIDLTNDSVLPATTILEMLDVEEGDVYDYWTVEERLEKIEEELQDRGYLFPSTELQEKEVEERRVNVAIKVHAGFQREMVFQNFPPTKHQREKYMRYWRQGFSEEGVLELIREDFLRGLWFRGYHQAKVRRETKKGNGVVVHTFITETGPLYKNAELIFKGAEEYPTEELIEDMRQLYTERKEMVSDALHTFGVFEDKIIALHVQRGFMASKAEPGATTYDETGKVTREIIVTEGPLSKITEIRISDGDKLPAEVFNQLKLREGAVFDPRLLLEDELFISEYLETQGYMEVELESEVSRNQETGAIQLTYNVRTGPVARVAAIEISGYRHTDRSVIERRLALKEGEILTQDKIATAQRNLTDLRIFHQATVSAEPVNESGRYNVIVNVIERRHYEVRYGFRYDTEQDLGGEVQITDINLFGTGQSLSLYTRINQRDKLYRTTWHSPTLSGLRWKTLFTASYQTGDLLLLQQEKFDGERIHLSVQRTRDLWDPYIFIAHYEYERLSVIPLESTDIPEVRGLDISRVIGTILADTRDDPINAKRGALFSSDLQYASTFLASDVGYVKSYTQWLRFQPFGKYLWASAVKLGLASDLPGRIITERFFAGGSFSVRGFEKDRVGPATPAGDPRGGEALFVFNQELRFPIWKWFGGVVFYDAGNVYSSVGDLNPFRLRHSVGAGLRFDSPFGIARIDYGINLDPRNEEQRGVLHFGIGQAF